MSQRWSERRQRWRSDRERINPQQYRVAEILTDTVAKNFVATHHYSGSYPSAVVRVGLYRLGPIGDRLVGVAVFSTPMNGRVIPAYLGSSAGVELGRFVLLDEVAGNGETWFLARAFGHLRRLRPRLLGVVAYADPEPRLSEMGEMVKPGHIGTIYQAHNARYMGRSSPSTHLISPSGHVVSRRSLSKIRNESKGQRYAEAALVARGAPTRRAEETGSDYLTRALKKFTRIRHPGNHVYTWTFNEPSPASRAPYPKDTSCFV